LKAFRCWGFWADIRLKAAAFARYRAPHGT
jgi:hypothetical protein